jgi:hypothetical protein
VAAVALSVQPSFAANASARAMAVSWLTMNAEVCVHSADSKIPRLKRFSPPIGAVISAQTAIPPAEVPAMVTFCGLPPKARMFSWIQRKAWSMSSRP